MMVKAKETQKLEAQGLTSRERAHRLLDQMAFFGDLGNLNPFKVRAFRVARDTVETLTDSEWEAHLRARTLTDLTGIGAGISKALLEFAESGTCEEFQKIRGDFPDSLYELSQLKGLGPSKVRALFEGLGIRTIGELEYACRENRLVELPHFGLKTQNKILENIEAWKAGRGKQLLSDALFIASQIETELPKKFRARRVGSLGRKLEIIDSFDYLIEAENTAQSLPTLRKVEAIEHLEEKDPHLLEGRTRATPVRLHLCRQDEAAIREVALTSSKEHWKSLLEAAAQRKLSLTEHSLKSNDGMDLRISSPVEFYKTLGLPFHPEESREFAVRTREFNLVSVSDLMGVFHIHTVRSDGVNTLEEMANAAAAHGWSYLGISEHSETAFYANGLNATRVKEQEQEIKDWNAQRRGPFLFSGVESDILKDGSLDYPESILERLDFVIASVHNRYGLDDMTDRMIRAIENPHTTMMGHLSGRLLLSRPPYGMDVRKVIDAAIANQTVIELNANPQRLDVDWRYLAGACERGLLIAINPDAHSTRGLDDVEFGVWMARKAGVPKESVLNTWKKEDVQKFLSH